LGQLQVRNIFTTLVLAILRATTDDSGFKYVRTGELGADFGFIPYGGPYLNSAFNRVAKSQFHNHAVARKGLYAAGDLGFGEEVDA